MSSVLDERSNEWFRILLIFRDVSSIALMYPRAKKKISHFVYLRTYIGCGVSARMDASRQQKKIEFDRNYWYKHSLRYKETRGLAKKKEKIYKHGDTRIRLRIQIDWHCDQG